MSTHEPPDLPPKLPRPPVERRAAASAAVNAAPARPGSISKGIGLAWLIMVVGEPISFSAGTTFAAAFVFVPPLAIMVAGVTLLVQTGSRTGTGLLLGLVTVLATALLLVAACFGLFVAMR